MSDNAHINEHRKIWTLPVMRSGLALFLHMNHDGRVLTYAHTKALYTDVFNVKSCSNKIFAVQVLAVTFVSSASTASVQVNLETLVMPSPGACRSIPSCSQLKNDQFHHLLIGTIAVGFKGIYKYSHYRLICQVPQGA